MTNELVVIINSLKVPKIKEILLYEMKFLVPNYSCLQNPWLGGYRPPDPRCLCPLSSADFVEPPPHEKNSWVRHWYLRPDYKIDIYVTSVCVSAFMDSGLSDYDVVCDSRNFENHTHNRHGVIAHNTWNLSSVAVRTWSLAQICVSHSMPTCRRHVRSSVLMRNDHKEDKSVECLYFHDARVAIVFTSRINTCICYRFRFVNAWLIGLQISDPTRTDAVFFSL